MIITERTGCRVVKRCSELVKEIRKDFQSMVDGNSDIDRDFNDEDTVESYLNFLVELHINDWLVIDDRYER